ncbi:NTP transferase domain-containing protein [Pusillimonas sp.]|uniref:nucleotidyltransferase family protein n=1 Tax=Pusillimonas sp. TaxID=3040095 RepID=UPI0037CCAE70
MSTYTVPSPAEPASAPDDAAPVVAAILAAGLSRRMGGLNKLVQEIDGVPMVRRVAQRALASRCKRVMVVVGHHADDVRSALSGLPVQFVDNPEYQEGLAASVRAAARAARPGEALIICLGDMPQVSTVVIDELIQAYQDTQADETDQTRARRAAGQPQDRSCGVRHILDASGDEGGGVRHVPDASEDVVGRRGSIAAFQPEYAGKRGNPVLWAPQALPSLTHLSGDEGARTLLKRLGDAVSAVPVQSAGILMDVDTPEALSEARRQGDRPIDETTADKHS